MTRDLDRWSSNANAPEGLQELLRSARTDVPSAKELGGLEAKLGALLDAAPPPAAAPHPEAAPSSGVPGLAKLAVLAAVAGLVGTGVYFGTRDTEPEPAPVPVTAPQKQPAPKAEPPAVAPPAADSAPAAQASETPALDRAAPKAHAPAASKPSEAALLNQAQQALKTDPRRALDLTRRHKQLYPQGSLSQEREVIAIEALSRLDKKNSAQERAEAFTEKYPESAHQKKVDTTLKEPAKR